MRRQEAKKDAEDRMKRTGLIWHVVRVSKHWIKGWKPTFITVSEHHVKAYPEAYRKRKFKVIDTFTPETETEVDLGYLNLDRKTRRKMEALLKKKGKSFRFKIPNSKQNSNLDIPEEIKDKLIKHLISWQNQQKKRLPN